MHTAGAPGLDWLGIIQSEYIESPGLRLTKSQAQRFWGLDSTSCDSVFEALVEGGFLRRTRGESYVRVTEGRD